MKTTGYHLYWNKKWTDRKLQAIQTHTASEQLQWLQTFTTVLLRFHRKMCLLILLSRTCGRPLLWTEVCTLSLNRTNRIKMEKLMLKLYDMEPKLSCYPSFQDSGEEQQPNSQSPVPSTRRKAALLPPFTGKPSDESRSTFVLHCLLCPAQSSL